MVFCRQFITLYIMNFMSVFAAIFVINNNKGYAQSEGHRDENFLALLASLGAIFNSLRFIWSALTDYYDYKVVYGFLLVLQIIFDFTMPIAAKNQWVYLVWVCVICFCEGGHFTLVPNVLKKIYGKEYGT